MLKVEVVWNFLTLLKNKFYILEIMIYILIGKIGIFLLSVLF